jgi:hypothetical protein
MYRDVAQWQHIRRRFELNGTPKKQISRETGISRRTINKMLAQLGFRKHSAMSVAASSE